MKKFVFTLLSLVFITTVGWSQSKRDKVSLNQNWKFALGHAANPDKDFTYGKALSFSKIAFLQESTLLNADQESRLRIPHTQKYDDSTWCDISLPHDWGMSLGYAKDQFKVKGYRKLGGRSPENSVGWYRKTFSPVLEKGCRYTLEFEGIFRDAQVWMNGIYLGRMESGYVPLVFDVTECLNYGNKEENVISVRVDATHSELWSYEGAGIYRNLWLTKTSPISVPQWGTFVTSEVDLATKDSDVKALVEISNQTGKDCTVLLKNTILDKNKKAIASSETPVVIKSMETAESVSTMKVKNASLWSPKHPEMYILITNVIYEGNVVDTYETSFGIRSIRFDANEGFFLNGERLPIQGVCCHQDHAGVGIAVPDKLNAWRISRLKEMGANAYRASHNPPTESVLNACDTLGMLVMNELRVLSSSDEGLTQMKTIIRRDRNHPSVFIWCLGNEEPAIQGSEKGRMIVQRMKDVLNKIDPTRPCTAAMNGSWGEGFTYSVDVQGSNYMNIGNMDEVHKKFPDLPLIFTEEASTLTTRGVYKTDSSKAFYQAYDREFPGWGCSAQQWMRYVAQRKYIAGAFVWTGFDYGGESAMHYWPGVVSNFGIMDYCGFPKDAFWYYKSCWQNDPVLHILPHWNGLETDSVDVQLYTNMQEVELFLNGKSLGSKRLEKYDIPSWKIKYRPGQLVAKGKRGKEKITTSIKTTEKPSALKITSETGGIITSGSNDIAVLTVKVVDDNSLVVPTAENRIVFSVRNGRVLGVGNGHPSSQEKDVFKEGEEVVRNAFGGYAQILVAPDNSSKPVVIKVHSEDLRSDSITLKIN